MSKSANKNKKIALGLALSAAVGGAVFYSVNNNKDTAEAFELPIPERVSPANVAEYRLKNPEALVGVGSSNMYYVTTSGTVKSIGHPGGLGINEYASATGLEYVDVEESLLPNYYDKVVNVSSVKSSGGTTIILKEDGSLLSMGNGKTPTRVSPSGIKFVSIDSGYHWGGITEDGFAYTFSGTSFYKLPVSNAVKIVMSEGGVSYPRATVFTSDGGYFHYYFYSGAWRETGRGSGLVKVAYYYNETPISLKSNGDLVSGTSLMLKKIVDVDTYVNPSTGTNSVIAIDSEGNAWGWGSNVAGVLGLPNINSNYSSPTKIEGIKNATKVIMGSDAKTVILTSDGKTHIMGNNQYGELGNGVSKSISSTPILVDFEGLPRQHIVPIESKEQLYEFDTPTEFKIYKDGETIDVDFRLTSPKEVESFSFYYSVEKEDSLSDWELEDAKDKWITIEENVPVSELFQSESESTFSDGNGGYLMDKSYRYSWETPVETHTDVRFIAVPNYKL